MKSSVITVLSLLLVGHLGSFLTLWELPYQKNPYTIVTLTRGAPEKNLTDLRAKYRNEFEKLYHEEFAQLEKF